MYVEEKVHSCNRASFVICLLDINKGEVLRWHIKLSLQRQIHLSVLCPFLGSRVPNRCSSEKHKTKRKRGNTFIGVCVTSVSLLKNYTRHAIILYMYDTSKAYILRGSFNTAAKLFLQKIKISTTFFCSFLKLQLRFMYSLFERLNFQFLSSK